MEHILSTRSRGLHLFSCLPQAGIFLEKKEKREKNYYENPTLESQRASEVFFLSPLSLECCFVRLQER